LARRAAMANESLTMKLAHTLTEARQLHQEDVHRLKLEKNKLANELSALRIMFSQQEERVLMLQRENNALHWQVWGCYFRCVLHV
jgi:hypothetical protein